jgi:beta-catenin-like protein 1
LVSEEKTLIFAENWQKSQKIAIITSTPEASFLRRSWRLLLCLRNGGARLSWRLGANSRLALIKKNCPQVSRNGALKVLDHALIGPEGRDCCNKFVEILGLRTIFPLVSP